MGYLIDVFSKRNTFQYTPYPLYGPVHDVIYGGKCPDKNLMSTLIPRENAVTGTQDGHSVVAKGEFEKNFDDFTNGMFRHMQWGNVAVIGGSIVSCAMGSPKGFETSDIDCYIYGILDMDNFIEKLNEIRACITKATGTEPITIRTPCTITLAYGYPYRNVQIISSPWESIQQIISTCDIEATALAFTGAKLWATPRARFGLNYRCMVPNNRSITIRGGSQYPERLTKYAQRGFSVIDPLINNKHLALVLKTYELQRDDVPREDPSCVAAAVVESGYRAARRIRGSRHKVFVYYCLQRYMPVDLINTTFEFVRIAKNRENSTIRSEPARMSHDVPFGKGITLEDVRTWAIRQQWFAQCTLGPYSKHLSRYRLLRGSGISLTRFEPILDVNRHDRYHVTEGAPGTEYRVFTPKTDLGVSYFEFLEMDEFQEAVHSEFLRGRAWREAMNTGTSRVPRRLPCLVLEDDGIFHPKEIRDRTHRDPPRQLDPKAVLRRAKSAAKKDKSKIRRLKHLISRA